MATQGIVSVIKDGSTVIKAVAGSNGMKAHALASEIIGSRLESAQEILEAAKSVDFGDAYSLVVQDSSRDLYEGGEDLNPLYREKFSDPQFNPRWEQGTASHVVIVDLSDATGPSIESLCCQDEIDA